MEIVYNFYEFLNTDISKWTYHNWVTFMNNHIRREKYENIDFGIEYSRNYSYSSPIIMDHEFTITSSDLGKLYDIINMILYIDNIHSWNLAIRSKDRKRMGGFNTFKNGICNNYHFIEIYFKSILKNEIELLTEESNEIFSITMTVSQIMK